MMKSNTETFYILYIDTELKGQVQRASQNQCAQKSPLGATSDSVSLDFTFQTMGHILNIKLTSWKITGIKIR